MEVTISENITSAVVAGTVINATISESITAVEMGTAVYYTQTAGTATYALTAGTAAWADATDQIEQYVKAGTAITKGQAVYVTGATGSNVIIGLAKADVDTTSSKTLGLASSTLTNNAFGYVITEGFIEGIDTDGATAGDPVWLSATTAGGLVFGQANRPTPPNHAVYLGVVVRANKNNGAIFVKVQNGYELGELHNVLFTSLTNGDILKYNSATSLWVNSQTAPLAGTATYATTAGTSVFSSTSGTASYATTAGTADYATLAGTAVSISGNIAKTQVTGTAVTQADTGTVTNTMLAGSIAATKITNTAAVLGAANTFTVGGHIIKTGADATRGLEITRNSATQSANLLQFEQSDGTTVLSSFGAQGDLSIRNDNGAAATIPLSITANATQSVNLFQILASDNSTVRAAFSSAGALSITPASGTAATLTAPSGGGVVLLVRNSSLNPIYSFNASTGAAMRLVSIDNNYFGTGSVPLTVANVYSTSTTTSMIVKAAPSGTGDIFQFQTSGNAVLGGRNAVAQLWSGSTAPVTVTTGGATSGTSSGTTATMTTASAHGLAAGDLVTIAGVTPSGYNGTYIIATVPTTTSYTVTTSGSNLGNSTVSGTTAVPAQASITARSAGTVGMVIRAAASQSANLQTWQNSSGGGVASVTNAGSIYGASLNTNNEWVRLLEANSGGTLQLTKMTAQAGSPGANVARMYLRDGTNANTLKLVVRAGAAGAETTILDNIPT